MDFEIVTAVPASRGKYSDLVDAVIATEKGGFIRIPALKDVNYITVRKAVADALSPIGRRDLRMKCKREGEYSYLWVVKK